MQLSFGLRVAAWLLLGTVPSLGASPPPSAAATEGAPGVWTELGDGLPRRGQWRNGFVVADFDGDGTLDLAHGPPRRAPGPPWIFLGRPSGNFVRWQKAAFPNLPFDYGDLAAGDLDGDGRTDLVAAIHLRGLVVLVGDGEGRFTEQAAFLARDPDGPPAFSSRAVAVGDFDGDGRLDVVAHGEGPRPRSPAAEVSIGARLLLNRLPREWQWRQLQPAAGRIFGDDLDSGDFDADGWLDLALASQVLGQRGIVFWGAPGARLEAGAVDATRPRTLYHAVAAGEFDGDGRDDLALAFTDLQREPAENGVDLLLSAGERRWRRQTLAWPQRLGRPTAVGRGDVDGDGLHDLAVLSEHGAVALFTRTAKTLRLADVLPPERGGAGCRGYHVRLADLDGDHRAEIIAGFADERCPSAGSLRVWSWRSEPSAAAR